MKKYLKITTEVIKTKENKNWLILGCERDRFKKRRIGSYKWRKEVYDIGWKGLLK